MELYVRVKWKGFAKPTWEPIDNLQDGELKDDWLLEHQIEIDELRAKLEDEIEQAKIAVDKDNYELLNAWWMKEGEHKVAYLVDNGILKQPKSIYDIEMPTTLKEAQDGPFGPQLEEAYTKEVNGILERGTVEVVPYDKKMGRLIKNKAVFTIKLLADGTLDKFKARIVAKGFSQIDGKNYDSKQLIYMHLSSDSSPSDYSQHYLQRCQE